ncbi:MAG: energy-coupling factor ABC transporter permease [Deltaproteobacteria bacterium]|nr:energy-coupling factor ABC transporter permease [Deltaproteobacteria bacterium]
MHITEGIITGKSAIMYTGVGVALVGLGASRMKKFVADFPEKKPLLGMGAALIFFFSLIPIPAFTGTCSHPCGTPLVAILLGPSKGIALAGVSLLLQAAFFAHGGFGTWGANVVVLGFFGCFFGWGAFRVARKIGFPLWAAGFAGGFIGDIMVYASSGLILGTTLVIGPNPQYSLTGYLTAIYAAYLPTQLPIAIGEMVVTGLALHYMILLIVLSLSLLFMVNMGHAETPPDISSVAAVSGEGSGMAGMDEAVNEHMAEAAGLPARDPYINTEAMGDLWIMLLLLGGGACGFIIGRWWHLLWGRPQEDSLRNERGVK